MRKENLKRKGEDDGENGSEGENSPAAAAAEDAEMQNANDENTAEENGDSKEPGTDDDFEDAETGDDENNKEGGGKKSKDSEENGNDDGEKTEEEEEGGAKEGGEDQDEDMDDAPLKKNGRGKSKPAKTKVAKETNGDSKANGDDDGEGEGDKEGDDAADKEEGEKDEEGEEDDDAAGGDDKDDAADSDYESGSKKAKKSGGAGKKAAPKKKEVKKTKPKPAKKAKKEESDEEEEEEEQEYEVQDIVDHRKEKGKMVYRIRWKNFGAKDDTWEPEATLSCPDIIKRYKAKLKKAEEKEEEEVEYEVQDIVDHRKEKGKMVYRIRWKNFGAKDDTWEPESTLSCPEIIKRYKAKLKKEEEEEEEEEEAEYEVQDIVDHRKEKGKMVYRIRWKNFGPKDDTWEPESTLSCPEIIKRYKAKIDKEDSAPPAKKGKPGPKGTPGKKGSTPKAPPKKRATRDESEDEEDDDDDTEYEVEKVIEVHFKRNGQREYLVRWKGFSSKDDTWEPEENLHCKDLIAKFNEKLDKSKNATVKDLRINRKQPDRLNLVERGHKTSKRNAGKARVNYYDGE